MVLRPELRLCYRHEMTDEAPATNGRRTPESYRQQIAHALDHAADLIIAAERVLADDNGYPNVAYHLGILAMEEIGRAGILAQVMVAARIGARRMEQRLDDHVFKLMHAVWAPAMGDGKLDPKVFEDARAFAQSTHARRMAGLYTDNADDGTSAPPRDSVALGHATSIIGLAKASLKLQKAKGVPSDETSEDLEWYLDTVSDEHGRKRLFSKTFIDKHEELKGDTRAWVSWAKTEFERIAAEEHAQIQRELAREIGDGPAPPKWKMKVRVYTASHSVRPAALKYWNDRIDGVKFHQVGGNKHQLLMEMTLGDKIPLDGVFDAGLSLSKLYLTALNVGSAGFFWFELTTQAQKYYESLEDVTAEKKHDIVVGRNRGLPKEWADPDGKRRYVALEESHMENAIKFLAAYAPLPEKEASSIFGPYLQGMALLARTDLHLSFEKQAMQDFMQVIRNAMRQFGDWDGEEEAFISALHKALDPVMPEEHRLILFEHLTRTEPTEEQRLADAVNTKRVADIYLILVAVRLWPDFVERAGDKKSAAII